jgi:type II secretory pathway pseudopilin PulG
MIAIVIIGIITFLAFSGFFVFIERDKNERKEIEQLVEQLRAAAEREQKLARRVHNTQAAFEQADKVVVLAEYFREIADTSDEFISETDRLALITQLAKEGYAQATGEEFDPAEQNSILDSDVTL